MRVDGAGAPPPQARAHAPTAPASGADAGVVPTGTGDTASEETATTEGARQPGFVRKLEAGGFNPVAELRLRLNHADTLEGTSLPPLQAAPSNNGQGYTRALEAYEAGIAVGADGTVDASAATDESDVSVGPDPLVAVADPGVIGQDALTTTLLDLLDETAPADEGVSPTDPIDATVTALTAGSTTDEV